MSMLEEADASVLTILLGHRCMNKNNEVLGRTLCIAARHFQTADNTRLLGCAIVALDHLEGHTNVLLEQ